MFVVQQYIPIVIARNEMTKQSNTPLVDCHVAPLLAMRLGGFYYNHKLSASTTLMYIAARFSANVFSIARQRQ